ncbi:MAG: hypothetical protein KGR26_10520 [Cyanobacteria bacterium REEB65]|nr:hypothetical protein [Cyanobacteria bacterium REEB65]
MPLDKTTLGNSIASAFAKAQGLSKASDAQSVLASSIAAAIDTYVKGATVTVTAGIPVSTAGTAAVQTGATTGPGSGSLS